MDLGALTQRAGTDLDKFNFEVPTAQGTHGRRSTHLFDEEVPSKAIQKTKIHFWLIINLTPPPPPPPPPSLPPSSSRCLSTL